MTVIAQDKPLDALREETIDRLIMNYGHGVLSLEAFQRRLDEAFDAAEHQTLQNLTADLDLQVDSAYVEKKRESLELHPERRLDTDSVEADDVEHIVYIFGGGDRGGNWAVPGELRVITIFGGADNKAPNSSNPWAPRLAVDGLVMFGKAPPPRQD